MTMAAAACSQNRIYFELWATQWTAQQTHSPNREKANDDDDDKKKHNITTSRYLQWKRADRANNNNK